MTERYVIDNDVPIKNKVLLVFDGHSYFHRAYNVVKNSNLIEKETIETTTSLFLDMIDRVVDRCAPDEFIIIFDTNRETLLKKLIYKDYKANRATPSEFQKQCERSIMDNLLQLEYPYYSIEGYEADQIISGICYLAQDKNIVTVIATKDKDLYELLKYADVLIYDKHEYYSKEDAIKKFEVLPEQIGDYLSLVGDTSDNIPGIPGVGKVTAAKLIEQFGTLEKILEEGPSLKGKLGEKIAAGKDSARISMRLVSLYDDLELDLKPAKIDFSLIKEDLMIYGINL